MTDQHEDQIVQEIAGSQNRLFAYILTLVGNRDAARDILQETNLVLWQKRGDFESGTSFKAWSFKVAFMQVLAHRRDASRDQHRYFDDDLMTQLAGETAVDLEHAEERQVALQGCLQTLGERQRWLIRSRYQMENTVKIIAEMTGQSAGSIATELYRIRNVLRCCVAGKLARE